MNIEQLRRDTPGCKNLIHLNNAGAALAPRCVSQTMIDYIELEQIKGGYEAAQDNEKKINNFYQQASQLIHCQPDEIAFMGNASQAWNAVFYSYPWQAGDEVLIGRAEYVSNYFSMKKLALEKSIHIEVIPDDVHGQFDVKAMSKKIGEKTKMIVLSHAPTSNGLVNPAHEVGKIAKQKGVLYLLDTCQSLGQVPVNVEEIQCDFLCATGRKYLRGPRGTGFLYVRSSALESLTPVFVGHHSADWLGNQDYKWAAGAQRFETWEVNIAAKLGLSQALGYCNQLGVDLIFKRIGELSLVLRQELAKLPGVTVHDRGLVQSGIVTFSMEGKDPDQVCQRLQTKNINISVARAAHSFLDVENLGLPSVCRASVHYYNTESELEVFRSTLSQL